MTSGTGILVCLTLIVLFREERASPSLHNLPSK
jgi:hypothetical protein